jgi:acyl-CoA thioester hydrolase
MPQTPPSCEIEIRVRYAEVDQMGFLHHSRHWVYFEMGRTELLRSQGMTYQECEQNGAFLVVVRANIRYHAPARYDDVLVLTTGLKKMGQVKIDHTYDLRRRSDDALIATAETTLGCVDREGRLTQIPDAIRRPDGAQ